MKRTVYAVTAGLAVTLGLGIAIASGPIAVYALVDKVTFEPNADKPERIRIEGVFSAGEGRTDAYSAPQRGYLYLSLPKNNEELVRREWADLKTIAGTRQVIGMGSWSSLVRVRKENEEAKPPDQHPMENGLVKVNADNPRAKALLEYKDR